MKVRTAKNIGSISVLALLLASTFVIIVNSSYAEAAEPAAVTAAESNSDSDEVSAASGSNRFVVWEDNNPGNFEIFFRRSTDNGATWQAIKNLSNNPGDSTGSRIAVSGANVYVIWFQVNAEGELPNVFFRRSTDNGATWKPFVKISTSGTVDIGPEIFPEIFALGSKVYVGWDQEDGEVYFRASTDNGATWQAIVKLSNNPGDSDSPQIAATGSFVYVLWTQVNADGTSVDVFFRRSTDNGATWKTVKNLSNTGQSQDPRVAASGSNVYAVWSDGCCILTGDLPTDIFFRRSTDNGATWRSVVHLANDPGNSYDAKVAFSGSNVYVVWITDSPEFAPRELLFRRSTDNGATWKSAVELINYDNCNFCGPITSELAVSGSNVYVVWEEQEPGAFEIQLRRSTDNGATWKSVKNLSADISEAFDPRVAVTGSNVYVVWSADSDIAFRRSNDNGATWKSERNLSNNAGQSAFPQIDV